MIVFYRFISMNCALVRNLHGNLQNKQVTGTSGGSAMTSISATSAYSAYTSTSYSSASKSASGSNSGSTATGTAQSSYSSSATLLTLSASAQAALKGKSVEDVIAAAREAMTGLLTDVGSESPYKDGKLAIDMSGFDRRSLFAMAELGDGAFTDAEITAASQELAARFDKAMAGPMAVFEVTGNIQKLYAAALTYLEGASDEEKATDTWIAQHSAVQQALTQISENNTAWPEVENDPVVDYIRRTETGDIAEEQAFSTVASNARRALDQQIADAKAQGKELVFSSYRKSGIQADFSEFSSRALSAISLNEGDAFSDAEIHAAQQELDSRARKVLLSCFEDANSSSDPTALSLNVISAFNSLSSEERSAVGWNDTFFQAAVTNYQSASVLAGMLTSSGGGSVTSGLLGGSGSSSSTWAGLLG